MIIVIMIAPIVAADIFVLIEYMKTRPSFSGIRVYALHAVPFRYGVRARSRRVNDRRQSYAAA
jgi:hypothetical protein